MSIHYMDEGFGPYADRGFDAASAHLERNGLHLAPGGDTERHSRDLVKHTLSLEPERVPAIAAELFAEAIAIAGAARFPPPLRMSCCGARSKRCPQTRVGVRPCTLVTPLPVSLGPEGSCSKS
jgi:hypothetical protein